MILERVARSLHSSISLCDYRLFSLRMRPSTALLKKFLLSALLSFSSAALFAGTKEGPATAASVIEHTLTTIYQPAFAEFAKLAKVHDEAAQAYCDNPADNTFAQLHKEFKSLVAGFSAIELYRIGALLDDNRPNRFFYWPDKRRVVERQLRTLLIGLTNKTLSIDEMSQKSVALQGLPALERLLFGENATQRLISASDKIDCQLILAFADNMNTMAVSVDAGWDADTLLVQSLLRPESGSDYFRNDNEVLRSIVTQIVVGIDIVLNCKIAALHGDDADIKKAPLWRSEQSVSMISHNLESLRTLTIESGLAEVANLENELSFEFRTAVEMLRKLEALPDLIDEYGNLSTEAQSLARALLAVVSGIKETLNDRFTQTLGISAGFNSEDGD
jgi:predicted lipoprotein